MLYGMPLLAPKTTPNSFIYKLKGKDSDFQNKQTNYKSNASLVSYLFDGEFYGSYFQSTWLKTLHNLGNPNILNFYHTLDAQPKKYH